PPDPAPRVTVQLPVYNEENVVVRLLEAVGNLDWPADRQEIQLLDEPTYRTPQVTAPVVARLRARGLDVTHLRRHGRAGYVAGAGFPGRIWMHAAAPRGRGGSERLETCSTLVTRTRSMSPRPS
ncbi:MAG: hypothetical protein JRI25_07605, partial [Deltaproteobacteria bacterium]|nr:hypothetical protein [Deltaproteobacteria bacterium]